MLGENVNYDLWNMLSAQDKKDVMTNYAFGPSWMTKQFGSENVKKMNAWWNDVTGWAGAKKVLQDRIAKREFPRAAAAFTAENGSGLVLKVFALEESGFVPMAEPILETTIK